MSVILFLCTLAQTKPGPIDAFRANYAAIKCDVEFVHTSGHYQSAPDGDTSHQSAWARLSREFVESPKTKVVGRWSCDGTAEYYHFSSAPEVIAEAKKHPVKFGAGKASFVLRHVPKTEALWDGNVLAIHAQDEVRDDEHDLSWRVVDAQVIAGRMSGLNGARGPFHWGLESTFPYNIRVEFSGVLPIRREVDRGGHPCEMEIYRKDIAGGTSQFEVAYDPSIGYAPRYIRQSAIPAASEKEFELLSREIYVLDAQPCSAGGFVPTEWYCVNYRINRYGARFGSYSDEKPFDPSGRIGGGHFKVTAFKNRRVPVALTDLKTVMSIGAIGGAVPVRAKTSALTLSEIKKTVGKRLTESSRRAMPHFDETELREYDQPTGRFRRILWGVLAGSAVIVACIVAWRKKRGIGALALIGLLSTSGCGAAGKPVAKLTASFKETRVLYDLSAPNLRLTLIARNDGNTPLLIRNVDGGCSCRHVDQSPLPARVNPGNALQLAVEMNAGRMSTPQYFAFSFDTDHGSLAVPVPFHALPRDQFDPESATSNDLFEGDEWVFDLTHRAIFRKGEVKPDPELQFPSQFEVSKAGVHEGTAGAPGLNFVDTTYRLRLRDANLGLHKAIVGLRSRKGSHGIPELEAPIVWKRNSFLSTLPERVALAGASVRVFLRCPDDSVELTRVLAQPSGVKAVVSSPRELTLKLDEAAPAVIDGFVDVGTTANGRPALRIPVVRYSRKVTR